MNPYEAYLFALARDSKIRQEQLDKYVAAGEKVATARVAFAEAFLLFRSKSGVSDRQAHEHAIVETRSALDVALAEQEVARIRLHATDRQS